MDTGGSGRQNVPAREPISTASFYRNHLNPPHNPWAESDARTKEAVDKAVASARRTWQHELTTMHTTMVRKRLASGLQLPTLRKSPDKYWMKVQVEGIVLESTRCAPPSALLCFAQIACAHTVP